LVEVAQVPAATPFQAATAGTHPLLLAALLTPRLEVVAAEVETTPATTMALAQTAVPAAVAPVTLVDQAVAGLLAKVMMVVIPASRLGLVTVPAVAAVPGLLVVTLDRTHPVVSALAVTVVMAFLQIFLALALLTLVAVAAVRWLEPLVLAEAVAVAMAKTPTW
jgi:hypothetical protein